MRYLVVKNFAKHQHYKDRRPPWIKLHVEVLDDYAFACLRDASKAHLMLLWVLASKLDNRIPYDLGFLARKLGATEPVDVEELVLQGFIEVTQDDSAVLAPRKQSAMPETEGETEAESETELPRSPRKAARGGKYADAFGELWPLYPKRAGNNPRAKALRAYTARRVAGVAHDDLAAGLIRYAAFVRATAKEGTVYVMQGATFFGPDEHWVETWAIPADAVKAPARPRMLTNPTEEAERRHQAEVALADRYAAASRLAGGRWAKDHPEEFAPIKEQVERSYRGVDAKWAQEGIRSELAQRCAKVAGFPPFDQWLSDQRQTA